MGVVIRQFDVYVVSLDPTVGAEIQKRRPCLVISPDVMNDNLATVIIAPMTTRSRPFPSRVDCMFQGKTGQVVLDQIRSVDRGRLTKRLGRLDSRTVMRVLEVARSIFEE